MSKLVSISDTLRSFLESFTASLILHTHPALPRTASARPSLRPSFLSSGSDLLSGETSLKPVDVRVLGRFFFFRDYACFRKGAEMLLNVILETYTKNGFSLGEIRSPLLAELRKEEKGDAYYSFLLCVMDMMGEENDMSEEETDFLLEQVTTVMNDDRGAARCVSRVEIPPVLMNRLLLCYLTLSHRVSLDDTTVTRLLLLVYEKTTPGPELLTRLVTLIPDLFIQQLRSIMQKWGCGGALTRRNDAMLYKCIRSLLYLLHVNLSVLIPYADTLLDMLVQAKNLVLRANLADLQFLQTINLKAIMNKTVRYSGCAGGVSPVEDVRGNARDALYFSILSSILLLSSVPTIFVDTNYAFSVSKSGLLRIYSLSLSVLLCTTPIHNGSSNQMLVYTDADHAPPTRMNRNRDYFVLSFSRQERVMSFYLFNDRNIPFKSILRQIKNDRFSFRDYSATALVKVALLFVPCNSTIQADACSLCRKQRYNHSMSDFFIFKKEGGGCSAPFLPENSIEDLDFSSLSLHAPMEGEAEEAQPLLDAQRACNVCGSPVVSNTARRRLCCCSTIDHFVITPQSLMPQSFSQDCSVNLHLPPATWAVCDACQRAILCGNQSLSPSELNSVSSDWNTWGYKQSYSLVNHVKSDAGRNHGVSLSILLAHVGHGVDDISLNSDFKIMIRPWGGVEGKHPEAFRIYLQLTDMVIVWYDVLVKGISV